MNRLPAGQGIATVATGEPVTSERTPELGPVMLTAVSFDRDHLPGPGLATVASPACVVSAVDARGVPVTGLPISAFAIKLVSAGADRRFHARDVAIDAFTEVAPGTYALRAVESRSHIEPCILLITVTVPRTGTQARALVRVVAQ